MVSGGAVASSALVGAAFHGPPGSINRASFHVYFTEPDNGTRQRLSGRCQSVVLAVDADAHCELGRSVTQPLADQ